ncbi:MAG TPA: NifU family protein [Acidimicrobiia bacterium]|jgi:Fe/S biogenesis protein NfuA|nr:NifU family protein [Acidimicrobiia bacterium]
MTDAASPVVTVTDAARERIVAVRSGESDADALALWIEISGESGGAFRYTMELRPLADARDADVVQGHDDLSVVIDADSVDRLTGATLDFTGAGMVMQNPNRPPVGGGGGQPAADLSGPVAQAVLTVLDAEINPAIAAHGGRADLVAVDDGIAYVRMSGGCQGCGLAAVTLSQGIEVAILDAVPEVTSVVDVTDHAAGDSPYYESAKK